VGLIDARGHLFIAYSQNTWGDLGEWGGEIAGEVFSHCGNLVENE